MIPVFIWNGTWYKVMSKKIESQESYSYKIIIPIPMISKNQSTGHLTRQRTTSENQ